jgi:hypothetical protein
VPLDRQRLGGLMLSMLDQLEQHYDPEQIGLEDAVLIVSVQETEGTHGLSGIHWISTAPTFHGQLGLVQLGLDSMKATARGRPINPPDD